MSGTYADAKQIREWIASLAPSQGFYGRLLRDLDEQPELYEELAKNKFRSAVDMVLYLEG